MNSNVVKPLAVRKLPHTIQAEGLGRVTGNIIVASEHDSLTLSNVSAFVANNDIANLFAAAPEILGALENAERIIWGAVDNKEIVLSPEEGRSMENIAAAIAKAKGESHV